MSSNTNRSEASCSRSVLNGSLDLESAQASQGETQNAGHALQQLALLAGELVVYATEHEAARDVAVELSSDRMQQSEPRHVDDHGALRGGPQDLDRRNVSAHADAGKQIVVTNKRADLGTEGFDGALDGSAYGDELVILRRDRFEVLG